MGIQSKQFINGVGKLIGLLMVVAGIFALQHTRLQSVIAPAASTLPQQAANDVRKSELQLLLLKNLPDFGFRNLIANWTFLNFLQYFGNSDYRQLTGYGLSADYFEVILERDPYDYLPYQYLSSSVSLFAGQPARAVELQEAGLQHLRPNFPVKSFFIWRHKGIDEMLFLDDLPAAIRSHEMAADWASQSSDPRAADAQQSLRQTAEFLRGDPDRETVQINAWAQVLMSAPDDKTRAVAIENIEALGGSIVEQPDGRFAIRFGAKDP